MRETSLLFQTPCRHQVGYAASYRRQASLRKIADDWALRGFTEWRNHHLRRGLNRRKIRITGRRKRGCAGAFVGMSPPRRAPELRWRLRLSQAKRNAAANAAVTAGYHRNARSGHRGLLSRAGLILVPLADWNYEKQIGAVGKVRDVRHPVRPVMTQYSQLLLIPMWAYDHDVRTNMKLAAR
jgi:hypothetical protein